MEARQEEGGGLRGGVRVRRVLGLQLIMAVGEEDEGEEEGGEEVEVCGRQRGSQGL